MKVLKSISNYLKKDLNKVFFGVAILGFICLFDSIFGEGVFAQLITLSIICTFGVGIGIWLGIAFIFSAIIKIIIDIILYPSVSREPVPPQLDEYISAQLSMKKSENEIIVKLVEAGWKKEVASEALKKVKNRSKSFLTKEI